MPGADGDFVERYLERIGLTAAPPATVEGVEELMRAHLTAVPFENLDVYGRRGVSVDPIRNVEKVVDRRRGGWCFELNGAFATLLRSLGHDVRLLGAAVLLRRPNRTVDHLTLEVPLEGRPHLVDVGFGDGFATPLPLNSRPDERLEGRTGIFGFLPSAEGTTLVRYDDAGVPAPQYRFRRVALSAEDFQPASDRLFGDADGHFRQGPVVTRLLDRGPDRVTLTTDRLRLVENGRVADTPVEPDSADWHAALRRWFDLAV